MTILMESISKLFYTDGLICQKCFFYYSIAYVTLFYVKSSFCCKYTLCLQFYVLEQRHIKIIYTPVNSLAICAI